MWYEFVIDGDFYGGDFKKQKKVNKVFDEQKLCM